MSVSPPLYFVPHMGGQISSTSKRSREKPGAVHILHRTLSVITTKPLPAPKAWRKWLTLFVWHEPVLACLFHHHEIFQTFYVRQARFTCQQANVFDSDQKHFCLSASKCWFFYACLPVSPCRFGCWRTGKQSDKAPNSDFGQIVLAVSSGL